MLDKRILSRFYSDALLRSANARSRFVPADLFLLPALVGAVNQARILHLTSASESSKRDRLPLMPEAPINAGLPEEPTDQIGVPDQTAVPATPRHPRINLDDDMRVSPANGQVGNTSALPAD